MCTLTFIAGNSSHYIAMNRDEKVLRGAGKHPEIHLAGSTQAIYPSDGSSGTWIGANDYGLILALLNWNDLPPQTHHNARSRGQVIPALIKCPSIFRLRMAIAVAGFDSMLPFRLVALSVSEREITEWTWDSIHLRSQNHKWESRQWFSSSLSDQQAQIVRGAAFHEASFQADAGSASWLRRVHASHAGGPGPFSICVHREDVQTLSYTEVLLTPSNVRLEHFLGSPCSIGTRRVLEMRRTNDQEASRQTSQAYVGT